jgi:serine/threonine protein kinase
MLNQKIKSFSFYNVLGSGAFARVYEAVDERDNSQVAIKAIPKQLMKQTPKLE